MQRLEFYWPVAAHAACHATVCHAELTQFMWLSQEYDANEIEEARRRRQEKEANETYALAKTQRCMLARLSMMHQTGMHLQ